MTRVGLRNLWARKLRTFLTGLAILLGVMMVSGTYVLTDTIDRAFDQIFVQSNQGVDAVVTTDQAIQTDDGQAPPLDADVLPEVQETDGVAEAEGLIFDPQVAVIDQQGERIGGNGAPTFGASALGERLDPQTYVAGERPATDEEVALDRQTVERGGFELGGRVELAGKAASREYELVGITTLGDVDSLGGSTTATLTLPEAQTITGKDGQFDEIRVAAGEGTSSEELTERLDAALPETLLAETAAENAESQQQDIAEFTGFLKTALLIFAGVALFVAAFLIFNTFSITVAQRTREFAMLRTLGANRRQIVGSVVLEAMALGLAAAVLGLLAGIGFAPAINSLFASLEIDLPSTDPVIATRTIVVALAIGAGLSVVAALIPAVRATRIPPVAGLREGVVTATPRSRRLRTVAAVGLAGLGVLLIVLGLSGALTPGEAWVGFGAAATFLGVALLSPRLVRPLASAVGRPLERLRGVSGRLARENTVRNPGRTATTAAALMVGLALVAFVAVFAAGLRGSIDDAIDQTLLGDLILNNTDGFSDIPVRAGEAVERVEGVEVASPTRYTQQEIAGDRGFSTLVDPDTAGQVLELDWEEGSPEVLAELGPTDGAVDVTFAQEEGLGVGDAFTALTASGEEIEYTVRGTFNDSADFYGSYVASDARAAAYGEETNAQNIFVRLSEDADVAQVRGDIDELLTTDFPVVQAQNNQELKDAIGAQLDQLLAVVYALLFLAVIVSLFGIVNTLALSIHERTRELGLLRAVGMSRRQVRRVVRYEAVITALIGAVLGAALGVLFAVLVSRPLADEGFTLSIPVGTLVVLLLLAALAGVLAAIGPARRASRLDVLEALAYE